MLETEFKKAPDHSVREVYISPDLLLVRKIDQLVDQYFKTHSRAFYYCSQVSCSLKVVNAILKFHRNLTLNALIQERRHREAICLLTHSSMAVKWIAYELGFCDPGHFIRAFSNKEGLSPAKFRQLNLRQKKGSG
ncbi:helix-turn-helix domain-containing protein [Chitinophaga filiformis]|uniref:AraC-type DNA-binding protein n=1 Tax=Chitinophaga filiformis TaxID=104663 RepID=A0A1G7MFR2_CHIFI|nr:AraC-type DNA-binding protein [Chitinophaga filiformis]